MNGSHYCHLLYLTESDPDFHLVRLLLADKTTELTHERSGESALRLLRQPATNQTAPNLIMMSWMLADMNALDFIRQVRSSEPARATPILVFTSIISPENTRAAYDAGASAVVLKPLGLDEFERVLQGIGTIWTKYARLPLRREENIKAAFDKAAGAS
jgi:CheY-like chemotaxis protein